MSRTKAVSAIGDIGRCPVEAVRFITFIVIVCLLPGGCGYRFSGGGSLPEGVERVAIRGLENRTGETGLENTLTNDLLYEFTRNNKAAVSDDDRADAVLSGTIVSLRTETVSRQSGSTAAQRRLIIRLRLQLIRNDSGRLLWRADNITANETYDVDPNSDTGTERNKQDAILLVSKRLAEDTYNRLSDDF